MYMSGSKKGKMNILILGLAGLSKSFMIQEFRQYLEMNYSTCRISLDPSAVKVPYELDFDIRKNFTLKQIMEEIESMTREWVL